MLELSNALITIIASSKNQNACVCGIFKINSKSAAWLIAIAVQLCILIYYTTKLINNMQ